MRIIGTAAVAAEQVPADTTQGYSGLHGVDKQRANASQACALPRRQQSELAETVGAMSPHAAYVLGAARRQRLCAGAARAAIRL